MSNKKYFPIIVAIVFSFLTFSCKKDSILEQGQYVYVNGKLIQLAKITTKEVSDVTTSTAVCGGNVISDGGEKVSARGVCWSTSQMPTINDNHTTDGEGVGDFTSNIIGLTDETTYYVRAYATNVAGTAYGEERRFTTIKIGLPIVTTNNVSNITSTSATCGGNVTSSGGANVTERGVCWSTSHNPTINDNHINNGSGMGDFTCNITGLIKGTTYYVRAYATNSVGTAYGEEKNFVATDGTPIVTTNSVSSITQTSAVCGGNVTSSGNSNVTARGVCWSTNPNPTVNGNHTTNGSGTGSFTSSLTGLTVGTMYYVRAYATNATGTSYGEQVSFSTVSDGQPCPGIAVVTDYDGNTYNTALIGNQCWMKENLRTTHYANGISIPLGSEASTTTAYYYYPGTAGENLFGLLYNWKAVMWNFSSSNANPSGIQGVCPNGWHVPSSAEWNQLTDYVNSQSIYRCGGNNNYIGKALAHFIGWYTYSSSSCAVGGDGVVHRTGFNAVAAGRAYRDSDPYTFQYEVACYWSSTEYVNNNLVITLSLSYFDPQFSMGDEEKKSGFSVRCLRN